MTNETEEEKNTLDGKGPESTAGSKSEGHFLDLDETAKLIAEFEDSIGAKKTSSEVQALSSVGKVEQSGGTPEDAVVAKAAGEILNSRTAKATELVKAVTEREKVEMRAKEVSTRRAELDSEPKSPFQKTAHGEEVAELEKEAASLEERRNAIVAGENLAYLETRAKEVAARRAELDAEPKSPFQKTSHGEEVAELEKEAASLDQRRKDIMDGSKPLRSAYDAAMVRIAKEKEEKTKSPTNETIVSNNEPVAVSGEAIMNKEKQATADDWQEEAIKNYESRGGKVLDAELVPISEPAIETTTLNLTPEEAAMVKEFEDAASSNKAETATSVEEDENKKFELSPEAKLNLTPEQQELVKKFEDNIANAEGEIKTRVEKTGMSLDPIRRVGEAYNKFPRSFKYLLAGSLVASGIGAGIMGAAFLAGTAGTVGVAMRVLGGAGLFVTIEKVLKGAEERKTGAPRSKAAELRHTAEAATFAVALGAVLPNLLHGALSSMHVPQGVLDTIIKYDPTGTLAHAPAPTGASVYQTPFKSPLSSAAVLDKMHTMTPPHAAPTLDIATPPRVVSAEEFLNQKIRHDISVPPIDLINEGFVPHEIPQDVPLKDVLMEGYTAPANEQMVSTPHGAEIATPKVEVKNIITGTEKGEGYVVEKTGSSVELTGFTGEEVLNKGWRMNIHPTGAGLDFDRSMVTMTGRDISGQLAVYKDLLGAGKTEEAAEHLTALHKAVELAEKSMGTGIIDHSKIPGMELNPNDVDMP